MHWVKLINTRQGLAPGRAPIALRKQRNRYACFFTAAYHLSTCSTASSAVMCEVSRMCAPSAGFKGAIARFESRASRSLKSLRRSSILAGKPLSINCLYLLSARASALAVRNTLSTAWGKITVPMSRPSATNPGATRKPSCKLANACLTIGKAAIFDAVLPTSSARMAEVTFSLPSQMCSPAKRHGSFSATFATACSSLSATSCRRTLRAVNRYSAPESR